MSIATTKYAIERLEADDGLGLGARAVLMALAIRANPRTASTYTGDWLCKATGMHPGSVRRSFVELIDRGYVKLLHRPGKATVVTFPLAGYIAPAAEPEPARGPCDTCGGTSFVSTETDGTWESAPCPACHPRRRRATG